MGDLKQFIFGKLGGSYIGNGSFIGLVFPLSILELKRFAILAGNAQNNISVRVENILAFQVLPILGGREVNRFASIRKGDGIGVFRPSALIRAVLRPCGGHDMSFLIITHCHFGIEHLVVRRYVVKQLSTILGDGIDMVYRIVLQYRIIRVYDGREVNADRLIFLTLGRGAAGDLHFTLLDDELEHFVVIHVTAGHGLGTREGLFDHDLVHNVLGRGQGIGIIGQGTLIIIFGNERAFLVIGAEVAQAIVHHLHLDLNRLGVGDILHIIIFYFADIIGKYFLAGAVGFLDRADHVVKDGLTRVVDLIFNFVESDRAIRIVFRSAN